MKKAIDCLAYFMLLSTITLADIAVPGPGIPTDQYTNDSLILIVALLLGLAAVSFAVIVGLLIFFARKKTKKNG